MGQTLKLQDAKAHVSYLEKELSDERHLYKVQLKEVRNKAEQAHHSHANSKAMKDIERLNNQIAELQFEITSLQGNLESTEEQLERALESLDTVERAVEEREKDVVEPLTKEVRDLQADDRPPV